MTSPPLTLGEYLSQEGALKGTYGDIQIKINNKVIPGRVDFDRKLHRIIVCQSPYFRRRIHIEDVSSLEVSVVDPNITTKSVEYAVSVLYGASYDEIAEEELLHALVRMPSFDGMLVTHKCIPLLKTEITLLSECIHIVKQSN